ncbi:TIGR01777 family oxidoreductase [Gryllotalpicola daejeonensis]|uniref:TIGR01777 family oxidoreductase n=1 Tax=Gryllotalpicola daejeonensis TaxID=993087 RepID=A0ABP7ZJU4_9MICO
MRIVIAGASGLIGTEVTKQLRARGDEVIRLVRRQATAPDERSWDPASGHLDPSALENASAVVNLAGEPTGRLPWTSARKAAILKSRIDATAAIVRAVRAADVPVLVNGSAVGIYGSRPGERLTEASNAGEGFLADVVRSWEATALAAAPNARVVLARTGMVIGDGGAAAPIVLLAKLGAAGPLGGGRQHWPWISLRDEARAIAHLIDTEVDGPVNLAGPKSATASDLIRAIARRARRPYWFPVPASLLTLALGDAARELLLADQLEVPQKLLESGFAFEDRTVADAVARLQMS